MKPEDVKSRAGKFSTIVTEEPEEMEAAAIGELVGKVNEADGTHYSVPDDADLYLLRYRGDTLVSVLAAFLMGETFRNRQITEVAAFTLPGERGQGHFTRLLETLCQEPEGDAYLRFAVYDTNDTLLVLSRLRAVRYHAELMMSLPLEQGSFDSGSLEGCVFEGSESEDGAKGYYCHHVYSECRVRLFGERAYIYGVLTSNGHRREHRAEALLQEVFRKLKEEGLKEAFLEVSDENTAAVELYRKLGFRETDRLSYYLLDPDTVFDLQDDM